MPNIFDGDITLSDFIPFIKEGSSNDFPIIIAVLIIMIIIIFAILLSVFGYCHFVKNIGICEKCWD